VRISIPGRLFFVALMAACGLLVPAAAQEQPQGLSVGEAAKALPDRAGEFRAQGPAFRPLRGGVFERAFPESFEAVSEAVRSYTSQGGQSVYATVIKTRSEGAAYSLLTYETSDARTGCELGSACLVEQGRVAFSKGTAFVALSAHGGADGSALLELARQISQALDAGAGGVPPLAMHLPEWERVQEWADYAVSLPILQELAGQRPALDAVTFEGGAEAATATYGEARLVVVEHTTPQYAQESDARVSERIAQLRAEGGPVPAAYRRVGNYSVFVFDAPDEPTALGLIEQVKYEKDVRWLGRNPHQDAAQEKYVTTTMTGVVLTTLKASGLIILFCLAVGGAVGGAVFIYRRTRPGAKDVFSDAGGMLRLNIEDVNAPREHSRLIGEGGNR
jgi:hypothetical protein